MKEIQLNGFIYVGRTYHINILNFVCDTPARAFTKNIKGHTGYYGCDNCTQRDLWTDHRMTFLLYTGPALLKEKLSGLLYDNLMLLFVPITILCSEQMCQNYGDFAECLLGLFIDHVREAYVHSHLIYNMHAITHLASYSRIYGTLHGFFSFPFENHLKPNKKLIRKHNHPLPQVIRRLTEKLSVIMLKNVKTTHIKQRTFPRTYT